MRETSSLVGLSGLPFLVALLVALPFATRLETPRTSEPAQGPPSASGTPEEVLSEADFRVGRTLVARVAGVPDSQLADSVQLRVIVALLPDPEESSLDWMYDSHLTSIRRALERAGYLSDRTWLPSRTGQAASDEGASPDSVPGVMVFRGEAGRATRDLVVVYVVGELPTAGVHRSALRAALNESAFLTPADTLRILGPTFSGSAPSLRAVLLDELALRPCRPVHVISGSATGDASRDMLTFGEGSCREDPPGGVRFHATVHADSQYRLAVVEHVLEPLGLHARDVALLTESSTVYGGALTESVATASVKTMLDGAMVVTFPLNVASVRSAYARNPVPQDPESPRDQPTARLPLSMDLGPRPRQIPAPRSPLTAPALDLVLSDMMQTLRSHRIRAVGIMATDVRDKIFLAQLVRQELHDVLLFTFEGHVLFARPDFGRQLRGMVVVSSYPLILQNVAWSEGKDFLQFSSEGAAGTFNAAVHLAERPDLVQEYRAPAVNRIATQAPIWLTTVGNGILLPVAVDTLHADRQIPVAVGRFAPWGNARPRPGLLDGAAVVVGVFLTFIGGVLLLRLLWGTKGAWVVVSQPDGKDSTNPLYKRLKTAVASHDLMARTKEAGDEDSSDSARWSVLDLFALWSAALAFLAPMSLLNGIDAPWGAPNPPLTALGIVLLLELAIVTVVLALDLVYHVIDRWRRHSTSTTTGAGARPLQLLTDSAGHSLALVLAGFGLLYCWQILTFAEDDSVAYGLYRFQSLRLESGVSGLLPFFLSSIAVLLLVAWHRNRRSILAKRQSLEHLAELLLAQDRKEGSDGTLNRLAKAITNLRERLELRVEVRPAYFYGGALALTVIIALFWWVFGLMSFRTLQNVALGAWASSTLVLWVGLAAGLVGVVVTVVHLSVIWDAFREFLRALADTPLANAFDRIPERLRTMGRLHLFDSTSAQLANHLAEIGHEAVWAEAARLKEATLTKLGLNEETVTTMATALQGKDKPETRSESLFALLGVLRKAWAEDPGRVWKTHGDSGRTRDLADARDRWLVLVEDLFAIEGVRFVGWTLRSVRRMAILLLFVLLFTTAILESVPFPYHWVMTILFMVLMGAGLITVVVLMLQLAQDDILSRITKTQPGKVNWSGASLLNSLVFVSLPVLALLGTEVEPVGRLAFGWLQNVLQLLSSG